VAICFVIGAVEALSLLPQEFHGLSRTSAFWGLMSRFNINTAGFVIVGLFLVTWLAALLIWRYARIEEKWNPAWAGVEGGGEGLEPGEQFVRPPGRITSVAGPDPDLRAGRGTAGHGS
jgi:hypothetical protein